MKLYIDKENLISLMGHRGQSTFLDCLNFVRKNFDVQYNFPKNDIKSNDLLTAWFQSYGQGVLGKHKFAEDSNDIFPPRPMKSNFYNCGDKTVLSSVYLLNDRHICEVIQSKSCILIGKIGEEINIISSLILEDTEIHAVNIVSWSKYLPHLPLTDIIICDNHYFKSSQIYTKNDNEILRFLCSIPQNSPINVVIITKESEVDSNIDLNKEQANIKSLVKAVSGSSKSTVTILTTYQSHDRALITNYYRIKHGSSFNLKDNGLKKDVLTEIKSHGYKKNEDISLSLLSGYNDIANNPVKCYSDGGKKSNFFSFK